MLAAAVVAVTVAIAPAGAAQAAQNNNVSATVPNDGVWYKGQVLRHKTDTSVIKLKVLNGTSGYLCVEFRRADNGATIGSQRCWNEGDTSAYIMANSSGPVNFYIWSRKSTSGTDNYWSGIAYY
ncbi:hypothetical protein [Paractinoplanes deccanensis]|uniref:hypothetical protein n=1 Tax=Paractinoplanes deccanensis TaxID=113561 RepID=UPI00194417DF|nr:hypothetical protein [Actinoplanes deccanensis]